MKNMKKKMNRDAVIIAALDSLDSSMASLRRFSAQYDTHIDDAALRGNDARARQLIKQKVGILALSEQLLGLKGNLELGAHTSKAVSSLASVPQALAGCRGLLAETPNFQKLGASLRKIFADMQRPVSELQNLNSILDGALSTATTASKLDSRLNANGMDEESNELFESEYALMLERLKGKSLSDKVVTPAPAVTTTTGVLDLEGLIREENDKA